MERKLRDHIIFSDQTAFPVNSKFLNWRYILYFWQLLSQYVLYLVFSLFINTKHLWHFETLSSFLSLQWPIDLKFTAIHDVNVLDWSCLSEYKLVSCEFLADDILRKLADRVFGLRFKTAQSHQELHQLCCSFGIDSSLTNTVKTAWHGDHHGKSISFHSHFLNRFIWV